MRTGAVAMIFLLISLLFCGVACAGRTALPVAASQDNTQADHDQNEAK
jgi:hypothetical protein